MAFLSRVYLNPLRSNTQRLLTNPQSMHAVVLGGVPEQPVAERVLWRLEPRDHRPELLVLTRSRPSWEHLVEQGGWPQAETPQVSVASLEPLLDGLSLGRRYALRVRVNPVVSTKASKPPGEPDLARDPRHRGRLVPLKRSDQAGWFARRLLGWGFEVLTNTLAQPEIHPVLRERFEFTKSDGRRVTLATAVFDARVRVVDVDHARDSLLGGVGRARAYGCGLVTLAPDRAGAEQF